MDVKEFTEYVNHLPRDQIIFSVHAHDQVVNRGFTEDYVVEMLCGNQITGLEEEKAQFKGEKKFKLIFSGKRDCKIIVCLVYKRVQENYLKVVTFINRHRTWHKDIRYKK